MKWYRATVTITPGRCNECSAVTYIFSRDHVFRCWACHTRWLDTLEPDPPRSETHYREARP